MDSQDQKTTTATSAVTEGHEVHGAHICRRCGWPFPNPHPSAKHRRAHKKHCGTIEGYKIIQSEDEDTHLAVAVDDQDSDDEVHSPSVKEKSSEANHGVGEKANKSEEDVFSDAAMGFSDSGLSQRSEESFQVVSGQEKNTDHKGKDDNSQLPMVDENTEKTEHLSDPKDSSQAWDHEAIKADVQTEHVVYLTNNGDPENAPILVGLRGSVKPGNLVKDNMLVSEPVKSEDKISEHDSANEQVVADSVQSTESIDKSDEKALAKEDVSTFNVLDSCDSHETCLTSDDKIDNGEQKLHMTVGETKPQSSDMLNPNKEEQKVKDVEPEVSEPPSYMSLVQSGSEVNVENRSSEIENSQNNQQTKSAELQVSSFPSLTNVVNVSEGIKKNEEVADKVIECNPEMQHSPLKMKHDQIEETKFKDDAAHSMTTVKSILDQEAVKDQETCKDEEERNSPERYLIGNTKGKKTKKKKSYWVPFMCCSSVHRDL